MNFQIMFDKPSPRFDEGLPIGNGRLGALITGGLPKKEIYINEEMIWYGGPRDRNNPDAIHYMSKIRDLMREGRMREAQQLAILALTGTPETQRHYSTLGMLFMEFFNHDGPVEEYKRVLDLDSATVTESYLMGGVSYELTAFASGPDSVIAKAGAAFLCRH